MNRLPGSIVQFVWLVVALLAVGVGGLCAQEAPAPESPDAVQKKAPPGKNRLEQAIRSALENPANPGEAKAETPLPQEVPVQGAESQGLDSLRGPDQEFWKQNWRRIGAFYVQVGETFYAFPGWDHRNASNMGMTVDRWLVENTRVQRENLIGNIVKSNKISPPREEALAATATLSDLAQGQYGNIHSVKIEKVLGPQEMLAGEMWLLDEAEVEKKKEADRSRGDVLVQAQAEQAQRAAAADRKNVVARRNDDGTISYETTQGRDIKAGSAAARQTLRQIEQAIETRYAVRDEILKKQAGFARNRLRLVGFETKGLAAQSRWLGPAKEPFQIFLVPESQPQSKSKGTDPSRSNGPADWVALNGEILKKGLSQEQFLTLLDQAGMSPSQFVATARQIIRTSYEGSDVRIVQALEEARAQRTAARAREAAETSPERGAAPARKGSDFFRNKDKPAGADVKPRGQDGKGKEPAANPNEVP